MFLFRLYFVELFYKKPLDDLRFHQGAFDSYSVALQTEFIEPHPMVNLIMRLLLLSCLIVRNVSFC